MVNFDTSTPQLKVVKNLLDAYSTRDIKNVEPFISKNYQYHALPESLGLPKEDREEHAQRIRETFPLFSKIEVCIQHQNNCLQARRLIPITPSSIITK